jgi:aquaporin Z
MMTGRTTKSLRLADGAKQKQAAKPAPGASLREYTLARHAPPTQREQAAAGPVFVSSHRVSAIAGAVSALKLHWPEYLMEAWGLCLFMISACGFGVLLEHPASPIHQAIADPGMRRVLMGIAMGLTAVINVYSPWGKQSGAHLNPSVTLTFLRLGKVKRWDALFYTLSQFIGGVIGVLLAGAALRSLIAYPSVNYVATTPGRAGVAVAFVAEMVISFILMFVVLSVANTMKIARMTGLFAALLVATYISIEAPLSGMSMNPARSFGSALPGQTWTALWIYFTAPPLGMLIAAEAYLRLKGAQRVSCAKLHHQNDKRCIFCGDAKAIRAAAMTN